jgi:4-amino-4-deoxy-L-arabinose transferase-like glycosyltransferase
MLELSGSVGSRSGSLARHFPLLGILLAYLVVGSLFALNTPAWQAPDEPAHYNYIRQLAAGTLPVIEPADYNERYRADAVSSGFAPEYPIDALTYEDWQPPLYYLLLTPAFLLGEAALLPLRLTSLLIGLGVVVATHQVAAHLWPNKPRLTFMATAFVAFLPQHIAILASLNNDSLAELIVALILWSLAAIVGMHRRHAQVTSQRWLALGLLLGLGFLTKLTVYIMAPVVVVTILLVDWREWLVVTRKLLLVFMPALSTGAIWWLRNLVIYTGFDPLATTAHDAAVVGQTRTAEWIATYGAAGTFGRFVTTTFRSFWGQFGWMGVLMDSRVYQLLLLFSVAVIAGLFWRLVHAGSSASEAPSRRDVPVLRIVLGSTFLLNLALYLFYNVNFVQHQGRYLFAALIPIAVAVAAGIDAWIRPVAARWAPIHWLMPSLFAIALVGLDLMALFRYIVPQLAAR